MKYSFPLIALLFISSTCNKAKYCPPNSHPYIFIKNNSNLGINWIKDDNPADSIWAVNGEYPKITEGEIPPGSTDRVAIGL